VKISRSFFRNNRHKHRRWRVYDRIPYTRLNKGQATRTFLQKIWKSHSMPISKNTTIWNSYSCIFVEIGMLWLNNMKELVWSVAKYSCESWTLRTNEEWHRVAFEMKGLRKTANKTNEWVLNKARVRKELLKTVKAKKITLTVNCNCN